MSQLKAGDIGKYDFSFKMIVIGDAGVGKSCLTNRAAKEKFLSDYSPTVGFEFLTFSVKIEDKLIKLQIWDTCGQEQYKSLITNFYRNASLAMMVYSIDSRESFLHINQWLKEVRIQSHPDVKIILIGNKSDLENQREITKEQGEKKAQELGLAFLETSAYSGNNLDEAFQLMISEIYEKCKEDIGNRNQENPIKEGKKFSEENELLFFQEASAKSGINAKEIFHEAAKILYKEYMDFVQKARDVNFNKLNESSFNTSKLKSFHEPGRKKKKCCS